MRQYCSGGSSDVVVDPPAARRLQQRVVEEEAEPAAGRDDTGDLGDRPVDIVDVLEHEARDGGVERRVGERQARPRRAANVRAARRRARGDRDLVPRRVDADHVGTGGREQPADLAVTAADVEHPVEPGQFAAPRAAGSAPRTRGRRRR